MSQLSSVAEDATPIGVAEEILTSGDELRITEDGETRVFEDTVDEIIDR